ncbi:Alpha/Beta hydrolase protein [Aspergillus cavernicola]|uniref:Alpha/Beta hydrolase protein n=1 Tax=Aspergillus cavernicola TaxID=176166 RepID=A0ABR4IHT4_9EURO
MFTPRTHHQSLPTTSNMAFLFVATLLISHALANTHCPFQPDGLHTLHSKKIKGANLSYKETSICAVEDVNAYSGYVHLPPRTSDAHPHPSNLFFYYAKSTVKSSAPLTVYLSGGPGASSMYSMTIGSGPCTVNADSNSTSPNPWSWTAESDILYIDQPVQTGFSYDVLTPASVDYATGIITPLDSGEGYPAVNHTFDTGVVGSQELNGTANSTTNGATTMWNFLQVWLNEFPEYKSPDQGIHIWTESFGGRYGPSYTSYILDQNTKIHNGTLDGVSSPTPIEIKTLGIHNGCSDIFVQGSLYPEFAYNNTYGVQAINESQYGEAMENLHKPGGCLDLVTECQALAEKLDPENYGNSAEVNTACLAADTYCSQNVLGFYTLSGRDTHDLAAVSTVTVPSSYPDGFFSHEWVQKALGARVNHTSNSNAVYNAFGGTGNALISRGRAMDEFASIMERGVKVNLVYGDRDYVCNWLGGENISLSIDHPQASGFRSSGYEDLITNRTYKGGVVRQHGNLSFTRVFEAGHEVTAYQPETFFRIFSRIMGSKDIASGTVTVSLVENGTDYHTRGPRSSFHIKNTLPAPAAPVCYTIDMMTTCTKNQKAALVNGTAIVENFVVTWPLI